MRSQQIKHPPSRKLIAFLNWERLLCGTPYKFSAEVLRDGDPVGVWEVVEGVAEELREYAP
jgi:hypothetical protein